MIQDGFLYVSVLIAVTAAIVWADRRFNTKFFKYVPAIVLIYISAALLNTIGLFGDNDAIGDTSSTIRNALLPAMIVLMLLKCDIRKIIKLGPKMLITYFVAAFSIVGGFALTYFIMQSFYIDDTWRAFSALAGSWTGGSANMVALQNILDVPEDIFGFALLMDTVNYSIWVMLLFWLVPFQFVFNRFTKADTSKLEQISSEMAEAADAEPERPIVFQDLMVLLGISLFIAAVGSVLGGTLPEIGTAINATTWQIIIASVAGLILAVTPIARIPGSMELGSVMLYVIVALIASGADFSALNQAPVYIISGFMIFAFHGIIMLLLAKVFKLDLFTLGVASLANIGGMVSAPVLAGVFNRALIPIGVMMALIGSFMGTFFGLLTSEILSRL